MHLARYARVLAARIGNLDHPIYQQHCFRLPRRNAERNLAIFKPALYCTLSSRPVDLRSTPRAMYPMPTSFQFAYHP